MATRIETVLTDDLDGGDADETVRFGLDGHEYEIDLSGPNAARLRSDLAPYVANGRSTTARPPRRRGDPELATIREWARATGRPVAKRGRISRQLQDAYTTNHPA